MPMIRSSWLCAVALVSGSLLLAQTAPVVRTADPAKRGLSDADFPRVVKITDSVYTYEDFHAGAEKFTTTNMFVVTGEGVLLADAQGDPAATRKLVDAIGTKTDKPIKYVVICSDHGDHTGGNASLPADVTYIVHPNSKATLDKQASAPNAPPNAWKLPSSAQLVS